MHSTHYQGPFRRSTDASVDSPQPAAACANLSTILESTLSINFNCPEPNFGVNLTAKSGSNLDHVLTVLPVDALAILNGTDAGQLCSVLLVLSQSRREFPEVHAAVAKLLDKELCDGPARYSRITDRGDPFSERSYQRHVQVTRLALAYLVRYSASDPVAASSIAAALAHPDTNVRRIAAYYYTQSPTAPQHGQAQLYFALFDNDIHVRRSAIIAFRAKGMLDDEAVHALLESLPCSKLSKDVILTLARTRCASRKVIRKLGAFCLHSKSLDLVAAIQTLGSYVYDEVTRIAPAQELWGVGRWLRALKISRLALPLIVMAHDRSAYPAAARQAASLEMQRIEREMVL
jgi:hypothetical protein